MKHAQATRGPRSAWLGGRSIRQKLNRILVLTTLLALLLAGAALLAFDLRNQVRSIGDDLVTQAEVIGMASSPAVAFNDPRVASENLALLRAEPRVAAAALYDARGTLFASYFAPDSPAAALPGRAEPASLSTDVQWMRVWRPITLRGENIGAIYLLARHDLVGRTLDYLGVLAAVLTGSLAAALLLSNRLQAALTGPLLSVSEVARRVVLTRDFGLRAPRTSDDEVGHLVDAFNAMLEELGRRAATLEQANRALRESDERYQLAVRGSSAGLWDWDLRAGTMFYSPRFKQLLGYSDEEFPDLPGSLKPILDPDDVEPMRAALRAHLEHGRPYQVECRLRLKSGAWRWFLIAGMAQHDEAGQAFRMAGSVIDVTERKEAERVLHEANRAKDEFIATLAHELRNPLAPIRTGLEILKQDKANGAPSQRARQTMERQLVHMIRLIDDLLDISRINSGKIRLEPGTTTLGAVVESALEIGRPAIEAGGHALLVSLPEQPVALWADSTRLAQSLGNLLNNAAKYTPAGGRIALRARREGDEAVVEIEDNGVGIPAEMQARVFSLFAQVGHTLERSQGGLGIGLYLVRNLIELHGGSVAVHSAGPGQGSTFTVRIPCLPADAPPAQAPAGPQAAPEELLRVLVVDDNVDAAETLAMVLEFDGHLTRLVHDGSAVLAAAQAFQPDVVLLDIGLPGLNGYQVAQQLRADSRFAALRLIALTGWGAEADRRRAQEAGFDHHLTKPVDHAALRELMQPGSA
jgi:PAS domain S-box-containing protein